MASAKVPVDHSAISGSPPKTATKPDTATPPTNGGGFLDGLKETIERENAKRDQAAPAPEAAAASAPAPTSARGVLARIQKGRKISPPRVLLVGTEGIGKSSWAAAAPAPIFVPTEDGLDHLDCEAFSWDDGDRKKANTFSEVVEALTGLASEPHSYQTVVIDSVDWLEKLIWASVCRRTGKKNIEDIGYAKGYTYALDEWREVLDLLTRCRVRGMAVILIAHAKVERFEDPENPAYDRYTPRLHKHAQALLTEWVDAVFFATRKMTTKREDKSDDTSRPLAIPVGAGGGERIIRTVGSPACVAKNRYDLPPELPLSWSAFAAGLEAFINKNEKKGA